MDRRPRFRELLQRIDRDRLRAFGRFLLHRFWDDNCFEAAGALAFTTVLALVPLAAAVFGIASAFPAFQNWLDEATEFVFANFVPQAARAVEQYLREFADSARGMTAAGAIGLFVTSLLTMKSVEDTFNRIWRVETPRPGLARVLVYWTVLTLGPIMVLSALAMSSYFVSLPLWGEGEHLGFGERLLRLVPTAVELGAFTLGYMVVPHRTVAFRHALAGGVLATVLFEAAKSGFAFYLTEVPSYRQIYGALAVIPILLIWVWLSWVVVLLGASFAASLSAFRYQPASQRLPDDYEMYGLLRVVGRFAAAHREGRSLWTEELRELEPSLTDDLLHRVMAALVQLDLIRRGEEGGWMLSKDLREATLADVYRTAGFRVPVHEAVLPGHNDRIGRQAAAALDALRLPLRETLKRRLASIYDED